MTSSSCVSGQTSAAAIMLRAHIINASNLPNIESLGKSDPYVTTVFQGMVLDGVARTMLYCNSLLKARFVPFFFRKVLRKPRFSVVKAQLRSLFNVVKNIGNATPTILPYFSLLVCSKYTPRKLLIFYSMV